MNKLRFVPWTHIGALAAGAALVVAAITLFVEKRGWSAPAVPWTAPLMLVLAAAFVAVLAYRMRVRVHIRKEWVAAESGIRLVALAKAVVHAAALVAGGYCGYLLVFLPRWDIPSRHDRVVTSAVAVFAAVALLAAGRWLEHSCRTPRDPDSEDRSQDSPSGT